jgi:Flp pilus assembly protein TadD
MKTHTLAGVGATALLLGAFAAGGMTVAGQRDAAKEAAAVAGKAAKALAKSDAAHAVSLAEDAVTLAPRDADYRMLLGQSYLKAGRFVSAGQAFADVLTLSGENGKAALNLALTQIAQGQVELARATLSDHAAAIPARDRGLALALAGDPNGGVELLMAAARTPDADARTRQNLALALALAGRWNDARTVVGGDVTSDEANKRIMAWIEFAKPKAPSDQVASLLGVKAVEDAGQPVALALAAPAADAPVAMAEAVPAVDPAPAPVDVAAAAPVAEPAPAAAIQSPAAKVAQAAVLAPGIAPQVIFAARQEVVQPLPAIADRVTPARLIATTGAFKAPVAAVPAKGNWFVQLGAYDSAGVAKDAWKRATRRYAALSTHTPAGMAFKAQAGSFYRLSVGGFARNEALSLCRSIRARGGACFVRAGAGDQIAQWVKPAKVQTAARVVKPQHGGGVQVATR